MGEQSQYPVRPTAERRFRAMGTNAHVVIVGPGSPERLTMSVERIAELEQRWSRFDPSSEVSQLNQAHGERRAVARETIDLIAHGVAAWRLTNGTFNPMMASQIAELGYDRPFDDLTTSRAAGDNPVPATGCGEIVIDRDRGEVQLPPDIGFDPGGIGKGLAADIISQELIDDGAWGVLINLGGDLAVKGLPPQGVEWVVTISEPSVSAQTITTARLRDSGLATSSSAKRRWSSEASTHHHILDPETGASATSDAVLATVIAGTAWWAEVVATSLVVDEQRFDTDEASLCVLANGDVERRGLFERFET